MTGVTQAVFMNQRSFGSGWIATLGNGTANFYGRGIAVDSSGNVYVVGYYFSSGNYDFQMIKYDRLGAIQWQVKLGDVTDEQGYSIAVDSSGNVYVVGYQVLSGYDTIQLAKYNTSGTLQWQRSLGNTGRSIGQGIAVDSSGNVYVVGYSRPSLGIYSIQLAKYNTSGTLQWQRSLGNPTYNSYGNGIAVDSSGNVYVVGIARSPASNFGCQLAKYNTSGVIQWQRIIYGQDFSGTGIALDSSNNIYVTGYTTSAPVDLQLVKCDTNGVIQWQRSLGSITGSDQGQGIAVDSSNNVYVVGSSNVSGYNNLQLAKYNTNGDIQWQCGLGNTGTSTEGKSIAIAPSGNVCVVGTSNVPGYNRFIMASLPNDGAKTGTYNVGGYNYIYYSSALIDAPASFTDSSSSLTDAASSLTSAASSLFSATTSWTSNTTSI